MSKERKVMVRLSKSVVEELKSMKQHSYDTYDDIITRLILHYKTHKK